MELWVAEIRRKRSREAGEWVLRGAIQGDAAWCASRETLRIGRIDDATDLPSPIFVDTVRDGEGACGSGGGKVGDARFGKEEGRAWRRLSVVYFWWRGSLVRRKTVASWESDRDTIITSHLS